MTESQKGVFDGVFDKVADKYDTEGVVFFRPLALRLIEHLGVQPGARVLDVGCGRGAVTFPLAEAVGASGSVVGIDLSQGMIDAIAADVTSSGLGTINVLQMDGTNPHFPPGDFDAITGSMSIVMMPDLPTAFGNYRTLLRPGGRLAFTAPDTRNQTGAWRTGPVDIGRLAAEIPSAVMASHPMLARLVEGNLLDLSSIPGMLEKEGFVDIEEHREEVRVVGNSPEGVVRWTQQHGMRAVWDAVPGERRASLEQELIDEATREADSEGRVTFGFPVAYVLARTAKQHD
ncbi:MULTISPECIES: methyltransferase domain-containing protein [unclassified Streptomyces]|uniref:methyltransferase domain-containing protein n=1 Tax=unclassified Streptomyces TaxID=2593676 RepID=UPI001F045EC5|nr:MULTISPECIES: methyltransferase domain-containing protein [unclassified Streptomyces]MCH0566874.1 methyltransferase domain-containing protein [Streptomyces sp. MUM 2J]MCH0569829.1 methyltransferase domain-containing protein [Streptomyces sp. MUM 136J]